MTVLQLFTSFCRQAENPHRPASVFCWAQIELTHFLRSITVPKDVGTNDRDIDTLSLLEHEKMMTFKNSGCAKPLMAEFPWDRQAGQLNHGN